MKPIKTRPIHNPSGVTLEDQLRKIKERGYVVLRNGSAADQKLANHYYYYCSRQKSTWVEVRPDHKWSRINGELFGPALVIDRQAWEQLQRLVPLYGAEDCTSRPSLVGVPNHAVPDAVLELLRLCEDIQKRAANGTGERLSVD